LIYRDKSRNFRGRFCLLTASNKPAPGPVASTIGGRGQVKFRRGKTLPDASLPAAGAAPPAGTGGAAPAVT